MNDIVEDLRGRARGYRIGGPSAAHTAVMLENAADEIEKLRAALRKIAAFKADEYDMDWADTIVEMNSIARAALEGK